MKHDLVVVDVKGFVVATGTVCKICYMVTWKTLFKRVLNVVNLIQ